MNQSALEGFVKIVELNSYSAAAEALYLSQSALSQQIRTLEGQLGVELFQHVPRKVLPYRWLPIREMYQTLYETELLQEGARRGAGIIPPGTLRSAPYGGPSLKMVPLLYYRRPDLRFARLLDWNKGHRFGIVAGQKADDPVVQEYVQELQQVLPPLTKQLFGVELEKIEV